MFVRSNNSGKIRNINIWLEAFHVFVAIDCSKFPAEIRPLMTYAQIVQGISKSTDDIVCFSPVLCQMTNSVLTLIRCYIICLLCSKV